MRNYRGHDYNSGYPVTELSLSDIQKIFSPEFLKQIKKVNFNGNLGDFGLARNALEIVQYFIEHSSAEICIMTNGSMRNADWWSKLVNPRVQILWAIDGLADTHALYRQDTDWNRIIEHACAFIKAGGHAVWKFIPFDHNLHQQEQCRQLSQQLGFKNFAMYDQGRNQGPVFTRKGQFSHWLGTPQEHVPNIEDMVENHLTWFDPGTPMPWINDSTTTIKCKHLQRQEIYLAADGSIYPCCWLGYFPSTMNHPGNQQIKPLILKNNALEHGLEQSMAWFSAVEQSWQRPSIAQGKLYTCVTTCSAS
jgi:sulfatase maturation enzyme AslB (radical SAM superfamily)